MANHAYTVSFSPVQFARLADLVTSHADEIRGADDIRRILNLAGPVSHTTLEEGTAGLHDAIRSLRDDLERLVSSGSEDLDKYTTLTQRIWDLERSLRVLEDARDTAFTAIDDIV